MGESDVPQVRRNIDQFKDTLVTKCTQAACCRRAPSIVRADRLGKLSTGSRILRTDSPSQILRRRGNGGVGELGMPNRLGKRIPQHLAGLWGSLSLQTLGEHTTNGQRSVGMWTLNNVARWSLHLTRDTSTLAPDTRHVNPLQPSHATHHPDRDLPPSITHERGSRSSAQQRVARL